MTSHESTATFVSATPTFRYLESFEEMVRGEMEVELTKVKQMFARVGEHFDGLAGETVTVGVTHPEITYHGEPFAMADPYNRIVYFQPDAVFEGYQTIFHELMHLQIRKEREKGKDVPKTSEEYCSIRTIANMPPDMLYRDDIAYLGEPALSM